MGREDLNEHLNPFRWRCRQDLFPFVEGKLVFSAVELMGVKGVRFEFKGELETTEDGGRDNDG